jgi:anti-sigma regulatory factor (Ser/Thr protein kinase)
MAPSYSSTHATWQGLNVLHVSPPSALARFWGDRGMVRLDEMSRIRDERDPQEPGFLEQENLCRSSGRGVLLMKALMDAVTFRRIRGGGMEVTMRKSRPRAAESRGASTPREA